MTLPINQALQHSETALKSLDYPEKEVFVKQGKSRLTSFIATRKAPLRIECQASEEIGHTIRFGDQAASLTLSATGWPSRVTQTPRAPGGLRLPTLEVAHSVAHGVERYVERSVTRSSFSGDGGADQGSSPAPPGRLGKVLAGPATSGHPASDRALLSEGEARRMIENVTEHLCSELDGPFLLSGKLEDGAAESLVTNGHGVQARQRTRITSLRLQLSAKGKSVSVYTGGSEGVAIRPTALIQRLVDKLQIGLRAKRVSLDSSAALLAPEVMCALLQATAAQFLDPEFCQAAPFPSAISLVDDPTLAGGVVFATHDGEGVPTRRTQLINRGTPEHWLRPWTTDRPETPRESDTPSGSATGRPKVPITGCRYRSSWRDLPSHGVSNLILEPSDIAPRELVANLNDGVYLIGCDPIPSLSAKGILQLGTVGFEIRKGSLGDPIQGRLLVPVAELLCRVEEVARDLQLSASRGSVGAPTTLLGDIALDT